MKMTISPEPALLGFLRGRPIHGYELYKRVTLELGPVWRLGLSQMYAILNEYAERGWVRTRVEVQGLRPSKKVLELTPAGRRAFETWMAQPARGMRELRVDFFARLYFARFAGPCAFEELIDQQIAECRRELETLERAALGPVKRQDHFQESVRRFRIEQLQAALRWLSALRRQPVIRQARSKSGRVRKPAKVSDRQVKGALR